MHCNKKYMYLKVLIAYKSISCLLVPAPFSPRPVSSSSVSPSLPSLSVLLLPLGVSLLSLGSFFFSGLVTKCYETFSFSPLSTVSEMSVSIVVLLLSVV